MFGMDGRGYMLAFNGARSTARPLPDYPVVLFDFDGTVADTQPAIFRCAQDVLRKHGYECDPERMRLMIGPPLEEGFSLVSAMGSEEALQCAEEYRELFHATVTPDEFPLMPGMRELLDGLVASGRRIAVGTSRMEDSARAMVEALGLDQFEAVVGRVHGVRYSKAESIEGALMALRASAHDTVMVGDRMHDVIGAADWEIPCIGFYSGAAHPGELEDAGAVATCRSVPELASLLGL